MEKTFQLNIDIKADIIEKITPDMVKKRINEDYNGEIYIPQDAVEKLQAILSYIVKNENYLIDILIGDLLQSQTTYGGPTDLGKYFRPKVFERIARNLGSEMGHDYEVFIKDLFNLQIAVAAKSLYKIKKKFLAKGKDMGLTYDSMMNTYLDSQISTDGKAPELNIEDDILISESISEFLILLLMDCLLAYKITGASFKEIKKAS